MTSLMDKTSADSDQPTRAPRRGSLVERAAERLGTTSDLRGADAPRREVRPGLSGGGRGPGGGGDGGGHGGSGGGPRAPDHVPLEVSIDLDRLHAEGMVTPRPSRSVIAEEYRMIKRPLLQQAFTYRRGEVRKNNLIMVTSALPSEGKSFTSINLAMSIAKERDLHVLLVDSDLSRPNIGQTLGVSAEKGLTDLLDDPSLSVPDVLLRTNVPNLSVILAGRPHAMGTELLASHRAGQIIREIAERYKDRIIIFDSAPALVSAEGTALSPHVGQILLIVEAERTTEGEIKGALDTLSACDNIQLVLNKVRTRFGARTKAMYNGYYYYGSYT
ncbi:XrtA-associated tyrosine autokinase [Caenispirillum salinarum]|uniref:XrtA-associated tyrosine autokinase n=1 Tax=Caenispirillum salinarum TaxID=859058 RepID=UPI00384DE2B1